VRAVLDVNVIVSALLAPDGVPAQLMVRWIAGDFELVVSPQLLDELARVLAYPKIRARIDGDNAADVVELLRTQGVLVDAPPSEAPVNSPDPDDDYLIALAASSGAVLVSGDSHVLSLAARLPIHTPTEFQARLDVAS
jgi:uncharacterized protein